MNTVYKGFASLMDGARLTDLARLYRRAHLRFNMPTVSKRGVDAHISYLSDVEKMPVASDRRCNVVFSVVGLAVVGLACCTWHPSPDSIAQVFTCAALLDASVLKLHPVTGPAAWLRG